MNPLIVKPMLYAAGAGAALCIALSTGWYVHAGMLQSDLEAARKTGAEAAAELKTANKTVADLRASGQRAKERAAGALKAAREVSKGQQATIDALQGRILAGAEKDCKPAVAIIREQLQ